MEYKIKKEEMFNIKQFDSLEKFEKVVESGVGKDKYNTVIISKNYLKEDIETIFKDIEEGKKHLVNSIFFKNIKYLMINFHKKTGLNLDIKNSNRVYLSPSYHVLLLKNKKIHNIGLENSCINYVNFESEPSLKDFETININTENFNIKVFVEVLEELIDNKEFISFKYHLNIDYVLNVDKIYFK